MNDTLNIKLYILSLIQSILLFIIFVFLLNSNDKNKKEMMIINQKLDSIKAGQNYQQERMELLMHNSYVYSTAILDSVNLTNKSTNSVREKLDQTNKILWITVNGLDKK